MWITVFINVQLEEDGLEHKPAAVSRVVCTALAATRHQSSNSSQEFILIFVNLKQPLLTTIDKGGFSTTTGAFLASVYVWWRDFWCHVTASGAVARCINKAINTSDLSATFSCRLLCGWYLWQAAGHRAWQVSKYQPTGWLAAGWWTDVSDELCWLGVRLRVAERRPP